MGSSESIQRRHRSSVFTNLGVVTCIYSIKIKNVWRFFYFFKKSMYGQFDVPTCACLTLTNPILFLFLCFLTSLFCSVISDLCGKILLFWSSPAIGKVQDFLLLLRRTSIQTVVHWLKRERSFLSLHKPRRPICQSVCVTIFETATGTISFCQITLYDCNICTK